MHLNLKVELGVVVLFVRSFCNPIKCKDAIIFNFSDSIHVNCVVLKVNRRFLKLIYDTVLNLRVDLRVYEPTRADY